MTPVYREYMLHKAKMNNTNEELRKRNSEIINDKVIRNGMTQGLQITNMSDAYSLVRNSSHTPSPDEINYRRFSSGSFVDKEPEN